jgi:hypothetical protein
MRNFLQMFRLSLAAAAAAIIVVIAMQTNLAYGHFFGAAKDVDGYQVIFAPSPSTTVAGSNSTLLNFSILKDGVNINNIHSALAITNRSGAIVDQIAYRPYEFSDITIPYAFERPGDYAVALHTRIAGDEKYQADALVASFDISVTDPNQLVPFDELMLFYVTPAAAVIVGIAIYLHSKKKL